MKSHLLSQKKEVLRDLECITEELDRFKREINEQMIKKMEKQEFMELKAKLNSQLEEKVDIMEV